MSEVFDIIGDIHGEADALRRLLSALGYVEQGRAGFLSPAGRRALFVGDYIDRGPAIADCLRLVRAMVDSGNAIALLGNHEYNALALNHYANGLALRSQDKWCQHEETHRQLCDARARRRNCRWAEHSAITTAVSAVRCASNGGRWANARVGGRRLSKTSMRHGPARVLMWEFWTRLGFILVMSSRCFAAIMG